MFPLTTLSAYSAFSDHHSLPAKATLTPPHKVCENRHRDGSLDVPPASGILKGQQQVGLDVRSRKMYVGPNVLRSWLRNRRGGPAWHLCVGGDGVGRSHFHTEDIYCTG